MYIQEIIIDGFKSYAHRTTVQGYVPHDKLSLYRPCLWLLDSTVATKVEAVCSDVND